MISVPVGCLVPMRLWLGMKPLLRASHPHSLSCLCVPSQEKAAFRELIAQLELDPKCRGLPLSSFLILPFQRITRLKLLVQVPTSPCPHFSFPLVSPGLCWLSKRFICSKDPNSAPTVCQEATISGPEMDKHTARKWPWLGAVKRGYAMAGTTCPLPAGGQGRLSDE